MPLKKIIVVDDEPLIPVLMKEIIEESREFNIARIASGKKEFMDSVDRDSFDAALIDVSLEGREGGLELLQMMKNKGVNMPLIMLSAYDELYYALKCLQAGARGYLNKKYICSDVVRCLQQVLAGHLFVSGDKGEYIISQYRKLRTPVNIESP